MLHVIVGTDAGMRAVERRKLKLALEELNPAVISPEEVGAMAGTASMFGDRKAFLMVGALASEQGSEFLKLASGLAESAHTFVLEEDKVLKTPMTALEKAKANITLAKAPPAKESFNVFALAGAMATRDRKQTWLLLMQALRQGIAPENIAGVLHWKARNACASAVGAEKERLAALSRTLVSLYHDSHRGAGDLSLLLEWFALTL